MAEGYWTGQPPLHPSVAIPKRPRTDLVIPPTRVPGQELHYLQREENHAGFTSVKDTQSIGASYDRYLQQQLSSFGSGEASNYAGGGLHMSIGGAVSGFVGAVHGLPYGDPNMVSGAGARTVGIDMAVNGRGMGFNGPLPVDPMVRPGSLGHEMPLPPDASHTLYVEGLPCDATRREVSHIFRPFMGYKEVRIVTKEPKYNSSDPLVLCFVDFTSPECAFKALNALQGYKMDEHEPDSTILRLQFARFTGPRAGYGSRGKR